MPPESFLTTSKTDGGRTRHLQLFAIQKLGDGTPSPGAPGGPARSPGASEARAASPPKLQGLAAGRCACLRLGTVHFVGCSFNRHNQTWHSPWQNAKASGRGRVTSTPFSRRCRGGFIGVWEGGSPPLRTQRRGGWMKGGGSGTPASPALGVWGPRRFLTVLPAGRSGPRRPGPDIRLVELGSWGR